MSVEFNLTLNQVKVKGSVFSLNPYSFEAIKRWYDKFLKWCENYDVMTYCQKDMEEEVEYLAEAFRLLAPKSLEEAEEYFAVLERAYDSTEGKIKEVFVRAM
ncbi:hypothetical protein [Sulfolobus acidocaldarius]|uniref:Uncharacterized protein n=4 Tax=Sulfolobus acidocaldarius TaxID=2285 RepID=Q4JBD7_SULAC|nr:hypothetical protein [Sulfolobus acidocaldarius]AAY79892.1 hypothetical protein Saci_0486 [Sulfolobus acidocaldarius DSM 639]AGE70456.1 hypothetical protein SacN8_02380 [Sulfolobus acidocaldarius N8]AGE72730.1 hypothetical protein SacRon12I_02375 [Sulfolobus acidocaldarius Ron12/I]ALU29164.1 hypothetical protein ATY89_03895 [Sulfolobus acidocaldarius]ALU31889.1 hypothetical protein ATZ20_06920 [Sulfolobus acidocaldarius]